jgi:predicted tellurium resistance membrane protein TerC
MEKIVPAAWWERFTKPADEAEAPVILKGQSKWSIGVPIFVTVLGIELCDSFLTMWNTFSVVAQSTSLFMTYSSTAFALMTVRSVYLVMVGQNTAVEPRMKHTNIATGLVMLTVGAQLLASNYFGHSSLAWSAMIGAVGLGLASANLLPMFRQS